VGRTNIGPTDGLDAHAWLVRTMLPTTAHAAHNRKPTASPTPSRRRSMPSPCLLRRISCRQDTERDRNGTVRDLAGPAYH
jgi:hypothetical protein